MKWEKTRINMVGIFAETSLAVAVQNTELNDDGT